MKMGEAAVLALWLVGWEVCQETWCQAHWSAMASMQVMQHYPITPSKNGCFFRDLLGASSYLIFSVKLC